MAEDYLHAKLVNLKEEIVGKYPQLRCHSYSGFLILFNHFSNPEEAEWLNVLPKFHLVISCNRESNKLVLNIVTFHGKLLVRQELIQEEELSLDEWQLISQFSTGIDLCQGISSRDYTTNDDDDKSQILVETLGENVVVRSRTCNFAIFKQEADDDDDNQLICKQCRRLGFKSEPEDEHDSRPKRLRGGQKTNNDEFDDMKIDIVDNELNDSWVISDHDEEDDWEVKPEKKRKSKKKIGRPKRVGPPPAPRKREPFRKYCDICLHLWINKASFYLDQALHRKCLDLNVNVNCPLCNDLLPKNKVTGHFSEVHGSENTCCCECLEIIPKNNNKLRKHMLKKHNESALLVCHTCGKRCTTSYVLKMHVEHMHAETKHLSCERCGKLFGHRTRLNNHLRRSCGFGDKLLKCSLCDKTFVYKEQLLRHLMVHSGFKPFKCFHCDYRTNKSSNISSYHVQKMHGHKGSMRDVFVFEDEMEQVKSFQQIHMAKILEVRDQETKSLKSST